MTVHNPDIGRVLPVYVADSYEGFDAMPYPELSDAELEHYIDANVAAVRAVPAGEPDVALANHLVMGPVILARGAGRPGAVRGQGPRQRARVHGAPQPRALPAATRCEGVRAAAGVLVGSRHTAESLWEVLADEPSLPERTRLGPPGVDVHAFKPRRGGALERLAAKLEGVGGGRPGAARPARPRRCASLDPRTTGSSATWAS